MTMSGYWRETRIENRRATLNQYGQINNVWILAPQGNVGPLGGFGRSPSGTFTTFASLSPHLRSRDLIYLIGVLREQALAPLGAFDVTLLGAANQPRQSTNAGVPTGGGATWLAPTSPVATTPLLELREQGWSLRAFAERSASLTAAESRNTFATSSSRSTRFVPSSIIRR